MEFPFANDDQSQMFYQEIVDHLMRRHQMAAAAAQRYVALQWSGQPFEGSDDLRYHKLAEEWADHIHKYHDYLFGTEVN